MKIVIAPDSYKGSLSSMEAAAAMEKGIKRFMPDADTVKVPIADGGEGTLDCMVAASGGEKVSVTVTGPMGEPVEAEYGLLDGGKIAVIEMAEASGLTLVPEERRNPLQATTYGTGELIRAALDRGCRHFILALGGSATNDGGIGMLQALGLRLTDRDGREIPPGAGGGQLGAIAAIDDRDFDARIRESRFVIASDVQSPLVGPHGATHVFGPQKGATPELIRVLEAGMTHWADLMAVHTGRRLHDEPGAGAAGGIGAAFLAFFPSAIRRGIDVVIEHSRLRDALQGADLVLTGEGQIDHQTAAGKTPMGIAQEARKFGVPTIALAGAVGTGIEALYPHGIAAVFSLVNRPMPLRQAMDEAAELLAQAAEQIVRAFCLGRGIGEK
jgi:glycerate kinase